MKLFFVKISDVLWQDLFIFLKCFAVRLFVQVIFLPKNTNSIFAHKCLDLEATIQKS